MLDRLPPALYRYSGLAGQREAWVRKLIVESSMYFPSPGKFNDPLDCRIPPNFQASELVREQYWREASQELEFGLDKHARKKRVQELVKQTRTPEGRAELTRQIFKTIDAAGTACFSSDPVNMLMWSYYAEGHTGVAIRVATDGEHLRIPAKSMFIEVTYQQAFPSINYFTDSTTRIILTMLGTKAEAWQHEREWRLVLLNRTGPVWVPPDMVTGIVLGMKTGELMEKKIREWAKKRKGPPLDLLRVKHKQGSFELEMVPAD